MCALLSPTKPVRTRFRVPGEGAYELVADILPAPTSLPPRSQSQQFPSGSSNTQGLTGIGGLSGGPVPAKSSSSTTGSATANGAISGMSSSQSMVAGPLGLPAATKISIAPRASILDSLGPSSVLPPPPPIQKEKDPQSTSIFSLRKISALGFGSLSGKLTGSAAHLPTPTVTNPVSAPSVQNVGTSGAHPSYRTSPTDAHSVSAVDGSISVVSGAAGVTRTSAGPPLSSSIQFITHPPPSYNPASHPHASTSSSPISSDRRGSDPLCDSPYQSHSPSAQRVENGPISSSPLEADTAAFMTPSASGVLVYNFGDSVVVLDLSSHASFSTSPGADATLTLRLRAQPTAHAISVIGDKVRLLVGCVNGEVALWDDVGSIYARYGPPVAVSAKRTRGGSASVHGVAPAVPAVTSASTQLSAGSNAQTYTSFNKDGVNNSSRVVAIRWLPGPPHRFVVVHLDGVLVIYDTRHRKAAVTSSVALSQAENPSGSSASVGETLTGTPPSDPVASGQITAANGSSFNAHSASSLQLSSTLSSDQVGDNGNGYFAVAGTSSYGPAAQSSSAGTSASSDNDRERPLLEKGSVSADRLNGVYPPGHRRNGSLALSAGPIGQHDVIINRPARGKRVNPVLVWQIGNSSIADASFSPVTSDNGDQLLLAIASRDGYLRIVDLRQETVVVAFRSYYGALLCVSWSPDGLYVAAGGEDDLVSIWCPSEERIVARCEGHTSWVSAVAWDITLCSADRYRLGSAGQDAKLLLWDFSLDMLAKRISVQTGSMGIVRLRTYARDAMSRHALNSSMPHSGSNSVSGSQSSVSAASVSCGKSGLEASLKSSGSIGGVGSVSQPGASVEKRYVKLLRLRGHSGTTAGSREDSDAIVVVANQGPIVGALGRSAVPIIEPVMSHVAHVEPLTDVYFLDTGVITADCVGNVKLWMRPAQQYVPPLSLGPTSKLASTGATQISPVRKGNKLGDLD